MQLSERAKERDTHFCAQHKEKTWLGRKGHDKAHSA